MESESLTIHALSLLGQLMVLGGLAFILLVGRRRHTTRGAVNAPAPGSDESPLFTEPKRKPQNRRR